MRDTSPSLLVAPLTPSILGRDASEVPIADSSLDQHPYIPKIHVFPVRLDFGRLRDAGETSAAVPRRLGACQEASRSGGGGAHV